MKTGTVLCIVLLLAGCDSTDSNTTPSTETDPNPRIDVDPTPETGTGGPSQAVSPIAKQMEQPAEKPWIISQRQLIDGHSRLCSLSDLKPAPKSATNFAAPNISDTKTVVAIDVGHGTERLRSEGGAIVA
jgi:hypothetical protein